MNPLLDKHFIELLDKDNQREVYAKIISLTSDEYPIEEISGKVSQGSLNIDGTSAVRRTCSLTIVSDRVNIHDYYWGFTNKFKLYIGLKVSQALRNQYAEDTKAVKDINSEGIFVNGEMVYPYEAYPDIIWFPQGIFLITDFRYNLNANSTDNIYITGKDKMCLINGDIGGHFPHATDIKFQDIIEYDENGLIISQEKKALTVKQMITDMIHKYANEPLHNIIVKDLDEAGNELLKYTGETDMYFFKNVSSGLFENVVLDGDIIKYDMYNTPIKLKDMTDAQLDTLNGNYIYKSALKVKNTDSPIDNVFYTVVKASQDSVVGYRVTDLIYPDELIANVGDTVTSVLDKIVKFLIDFEYFYNLDGQFVFQKKLTYVTTSWNSITKTEQESEATYTGYLRPNESSKILNGISLNDTLSVTQLEDTVYVESMKLVSQFAYSFVGGKTTTMFSNTPNISNMRNDYTIWGKYKANSEGKEVYIHLRCAIDEKPERYKAWDGTIYTTKDWDWRELIYQMAVDYLDHNHDDDYEVILYQNNPSYRYGRTGYEQYYEDMLEFWRYLYDPTSTDSTTYIINKYDENKYWNRDAVYNPIRLKFWIDFLDGPGSDLNKYSVKTIGDRTKVVNEDKIRAIYYGEIPNVIFITAEKYLEIRNTAMYNDGYTYILMPEFMEEYFEVVRRNKSAQEKLDELLYEHAYCNESVTITTMPIYHLEPNVKIKIYDSKSGINGEYIINKMTIPLGYNGTMSITASKAPVRLYG